MKISEIIPVTFKSIQQRQEKPMVQTAYDSEVCREVVGRGWLTPEQMQRAAERYLLGKSRSGKTIYWMIDEHGVCRDGRIGDSWVSTMLKGRYPELAEYVRASHCLFGLHLLCHTEITENRPVAVVESERAAVILSEVFPQSIWMAWGYTGNCTVDRFEALQGRRVIIYPRTDPLAENYVFWLDTIDRIKRLYRIDISVDDTLEKHATASQKEQGIDLVDFLFEGHTEITEITERRPAVEEGHTESTEITERRPVVADDAQKGC